MAVNSRYIQFYTPGSAAEKLRPALPEAPQAAPQRAKNKKRILYFDPAALLGAATAVVLMICMFVGLGAYNASCDEYMQMDRYVRSLEQQNKELTVQYKKGYDLEEIRLDAVLLGYVPESQVTHITLEVAPQEQAPEPGFWEVFLARIFA